jgi:hypothetical protein
MPDNFTPQGESSAASATQWVKTGLDENLWNMVFICKQ